MTPPQHNRLPQLYSPSQPYATTPSQYVHSTTAFRHSLKGTKEREEEREKEKKKREEEEEGKEIDEEGEKKK